MPERRRDSDSPPTDRLEHALGVLRQVREELTAQLNRVTECLGRLERTVGEHGKDVKELKDALTKLERRLASDSLADAALAAETTSRVGRLQVELAQLHAARSEAVATVAGASAEAQRAVKLSGRQGAIINGALALAGLVGAAWGWIAPVASWLW
jgi:predicted RNase H-like nuclease (RuvC/YqgF family)